MSLPASCILLAIHWFLIPLIKTAWRVSKFSNRLIRSLFQLWATLAIIDQHGADERIRLEELREKVLPGQKRTTMFLDTEQELVMPEIGYQLLHSYADQIQNWGWICNIHSQASRSFTRNLNLIHKQPTSFTLLAIGPLAAYYKLPLNRVVVFHDDMDLPCGVLRLHPKGGHHKYNGLKSVIYHFHGNGEFPRLRIVLLKV